MKTHLVAIALIVLAALWRGLVVFDSSLFNVAPVTALAFCGAVFFAGVFVAATHSAVAWEARGRGHAPESAARQ